ncbi:MAG: hypothetical protein IJ468_07785 [Lachnospiraceae bacterium]|nr:hypothetical protein [Lachnospiraceae bacterium]
MESLVEIFQKAKEVLCKYDYYIYTSKRVLRVTNSELKIPHLMGLQYIGRPNQYSGDYGVYAIKKKRITHDSIAKLVKKYYRGEEKQRIMFEMIYRKLNNLHLLEEMFRSHSILYLYKKTEKSAFFCDYLLVCTSGKAILHLGLLEAVDKKDVYHCNSFMATYQTDRERDMYFCNLTQSYDINKIVREDKDTKRRETVYQSAESREREKNGIRKMLLLNGIEPQEKLLSEIIKINMKFGKYHLLQELTDLPTMLAKCGDDGEKVLVNSLMMRLEESTKTGS